jgi:VanZ family protein
MIIIFLFSSDSGVESTKKSDQVIVRFSEVVLGRRLTNSEAIKYINKFVFIVRKSAHFIIYFILGLLIISYLKEYGIINYNRVLLSSLIVFLYACSDEVHQLFSIGRSCQFRDVLIDTMGGFIASNIYYLIYRIWRKKHE